MENQITEIRISDTKPLSHQDLWAKITALTLENERLKSELLEKVSEIKQRDIQIKECHGYISHLEKNIENILEENKRILAETVKNIREINYPELGNIENKL